MGAAGTTLGDAVNEESFIVGAGASVLGERPNVSAVSLQVEAIHAALSDAGMSVAEVDGLIVRGPDDVYSFHQHVGKRLGIKPTLATSLSNGGASQALGVALARMAIREGLASTVVCGYARDGWSRTRGPAKGGRQTTTGRVALVPIQMQAQEFGPEFGFFGAAAMHAMGARRHMDLYGTTKEALGEVAIAFREHASRNPQAQRQAPLGWEEYFSGRRVVDPFNIYDCSLLTDGAGAVVVTGEARARDSKTHAVRIAGVGAANNSPGWFMDDHMVRTSAVGSGQMAYRQAGMSPSDVDMVQLYDCFTYMVLVQLEDYGFCGKGEAADFVKDGALRLGSQLPANTSGGQLSEGHVEGMLQIVEAVRQLRWSYPVERQVEGAQVALVSGHGGNAISHSTLILTRD